MEGGVGGTRRVKPPFSLMYQPAGRSAKRRSHLPPRFPTGEYLRPLPSCRGHEMRHAPALLMIGLLMPLAGCTKEVESAASGRTTMGRMAMATPDVFPPVKKPPVKEAADVTLPDDFPVVGVVAGGKPRAYSLKALAAGDGHVVNDLISNVPVSVVYCDFQKAVRVFTDATPGKVLDLAQVGHSPQGLLIRYDGRIYLHNSGKPPSGNGPDVPLKDHAFDETTWKSWREKHPTTEVYLGPDAMPLGPDRP